MDKKEIIDEMARDMSEFWANDDFEKVVVEFYNLGYRKIPEGAVVLPREEYNAWFNYYNDVGQQIRKETAREFAEKLKLIVQGAINQFMNETGGGYYLAEDVIYDIDDLAKQFGVEVE